MAAKRNTALSAAQFKVMQVLWSLGEGTAAGVLSAWPAPERPAHTTVATVLSRLEKRGIVSSELRGRERVYRPLVEESAVRRSMVAQLVGTLFGGNPNALLAHLVKESEVAPEDLEAARRLLEEGEQDD